MNSQEHSQIIMNHSITSTSSLVPNCCHYPLDCENKDDVEIDYEHRVSIQLPYDNHPHYSMDRLTFAR